LSARESLRPGAWHQQGGSTIWPGHGTRRDIKQWLSLSATRLHERRG